MSETKLPLEEFSIAELFLGGKKCSYSIPIYQRNYTWGEDEIRMLVQDVYDAFESNMKTYYIGTLVSYKRDENVFEIIDGQQRLTTIFIILRALNETISNPLTYRARSKSNKTLKKLSESQKISELKKLEEKDDGIIAGFEFATDAINSIVSTEKRKVFADYFKNNVHIIHYQVPKDVDLNHYFEIMNSRGEQLEKHEIEKAKLMEKLDENGQKIFNAIWEACSNMSFYVQRNFEDNFSKKIFGNNLNNFILVKFDDLKSSQEEKSDLLNNNDKRTLNKIISYGFTDSPKVEKEKIDSFQPIIDFSNFLLIVLKITRTQKEGELPNDFKLDDKELLKEFDKANINSDFVKKFAYNLLKARFFLDNYIVHHSNEEDSYENNPWELQILKKANDENKFLIENLFSENKDNQDMLVHLLSMFEVSFTAHQRKNYLFYCLYYLMTNDFANKEKYLEFIENLADRYFYAIYLDKNSLNEINAPLPGRFDEKIFVGKSFDKSELPKRTDEDFSKIYGDGTEKSKGIPLFVFNYLDFKIWNLYAENLKGEKLKENSKERKEFFNNILGCSDFGLKIFDNFYFSRTRRSLEHYFPQANLKDLDTPTEAQINCFGNYAMIGGMANSSGSNWSPKSKLDHYLDSSRKINQISTASLKFMIMMQKCKDNGKSRKSGDEWNFQDIREHQQKMMAILF